MLPSGPSSLESTSIGSWLPLSLPSPTQQPPPTKGYPPKILGLAVIDPNFLCGQCEELLRDPHQASCGHRFCRICINRLIEGWYHSLFGHREILSVFIIFFNPPPKPLPAPSEVLLAIFEALPGESETFPADYKAVLDGSKAL